MPRTLDVAAGLALLTTGLLHLALGLAGLVWLQQGVDGDPRSEILVATLTGCSLVPAASGAALLTGRSAGAAVGAVSSVLCGAQSLLVLLAWVLIVGFFGKGWPSLSDVPLVVLAPPLSVAIAAPLALSAWVGALLRDRYPPRQDHGL